MSHEPVVGTGSEIEGGYDTNALPANNSAWSTRISASTMPHKIPFGAVIESKMLRRVRKCFRVW